MKKTSYIISILLCFSFSEKKKSLKNNEDWDIEINGNKANIIKYKGYSSVIIFPDKIKEKKIVALKGQYLLGDNIIKGRIFSIDLSKMDFLEEIDSNVFNKCSNIKVIEIPNNTKRINYQAFNGCLSLENVILSQKLNYIGSKVFARCVRLNNIELPKDLKYIGYEAFINCISLESILIPDKVQSLLYKSFYGCTSIKKIILPKNLIFIGDETFSWCNSLEYVKLPEGLQSIGNRAFENCTSLKSIEIPKTVYFLGVDIFLNCISLREILLPSKLKSFLNKSNISKDININFVD